MWLSLYRSRGGYIVAVTLLDGMALLDQFSEERIIDPRVMDLARRVQIMVDPDIDRVYPGLYANRVEVILKDGRRFETRIDHAKGSLAQPLSFSDVSDKFRGMTARAVSNDTADRIIDTIQSLETLKSIRELTALLG